jgi:hypothetical protein
LLYPRGYNQCCENPRSYAEIFILEERMEDEGEGEIAFTSSEN